MRLIAFAIVILAGAVALIKNDETGTILILVGAVLGIIELFISDFVREVLELSRFEYPPKPPTEEPPHTD